MIVFGIVATKGGVGKTTLAASLGGLLVDLGYRVLLIDTDVQPSLSKYFQVAQPAEFGLTRMVMSGNMTADCVSHVKLPPDDFASKRGDWNTNDGVLDLVRSDTRDGKLQQWLSGRLDSLVRIRIALQNAAITDAYDVALIDTQGALGYLQDAAVNAADLLVAPVSPDILSAREYVAGTMELLRRHEAAANMGYKVPSIKAIINRVERTSDSRDMSAVIRKQYLDLRGQVTVLKTAVPAIAPFRKAATAQVPAHWIDTHRTSDVMHALLWELIPSTEGQLAPSHRGKSAEEILSMRDSAMDDDMPVSPGVSHNQEVAARDAEE